MKRSVQPRSRAKVQPRESPLDFAKLSSGGPGPVGDYARRVKADGGSSTSFTDSKLKNSGAGFWADMARQGGVVLGGNDVAGFGLTISVGTVTVISVAPVSVSVTGRSVTASLGSVIVTGHGTDVSVAVTGQQLTASVGNVTANFGGKFAVTGQQLQANVGQAVIAGPITVNVSGTSLSMTTSVGDVTVSLPLGMTVNVTGQEMATSVGTVDVTNAVAINVTGQSLTASVGSVSVTVPLNVANVFKVNTWTGNVTNTKITNGLNNSGVGGMLVTRSRNTASLDWYVQDTARGVNHYWRLNAAAEEFTGTNMLVSFDSDGYTLGVGTALNNTAITYAGWNFIKAAGFFDIVAYTGTGAAKTVPHNLGAIPGMVWVKSIDASAGHSCAVSLLPSNPGHQYNLTPDNGAPTVNDVTFGGVAPDASNIYVGPTSTTTNETGKHYYAYVFGHDTSANGIIQCGSYTGNGSTSGPTITLGWDPQFVLIRRIAGGTGSWGIFDTTRGLGSGNDAVLFFDSTVAEDATADRLALTGTGFQIKSTATSWNVSGSTYAYVAIRG